WCSVTFGQLDFVAVGITDPGSPTLAVRSLPKGPHERDPLTLQDGAQFGEVVAVYANVDVGWRYLSGRVLAGVPGQLQKHVPVAQQADFIVPSLARVAVTHGHAQQTDIKVNRPIEIGHGQHRMVNAERKPLDQA